jgi:hypothetical protein
LAELEAFQILAELKAIQNYTVKITLFRLFINYINVPSDKEQIQILQFSPKDGSTTASTNTGKLLMMSKIQVLINNLLETINIIFIKVPTDKCIEHTFGSIRARMAELEPIK